MDRRGQDRSWALDRRGFLRTAGALCLSALFDVGAAGDSPAAEAQGIQRWTGDVRINGRPATVGMPVGRGDFVFTGPGSTVVIVMAQDALMVRENSLLDLAHSGDTITSVVSDLLRLVRGGLLAVFGKGRRTVATPTAVAGVRGTGLYIEVEPDRSYVCTCYGRVDLAAATAPGVRETVETTHHEAPRYILAHGGGQLIQPAPMKHHSDEELIMLEALVGRRPPFMGRGKTGYNYGSDSIR